MSEALIKQLYDCIMVVVTLNDNPEANPPGSFIKLDPAADKQLRAGADAAAEALGIGDALVVKKAKEVFMEAYTESSPTAMATWLQVVLPELREKFGLVASLPQSSSENRGAQRKAENRAKKHFSVYYGFQGDEVHVTDVGAGQRTRVQLGYGTDEAQCNKLAHLWNSQS